MKLIHILYFVIGLWPMLSILGCTEVNSQISDVPALYSSPEFSKYWYGGKAELTRYQLQQARYGEIHEGDAVLIYVTEDFDTKKQVKFEQGDRGSEVQSVLKLNFTRNFNTGIYPYSMMSSIFTPVRGGSTQKVTTTSQEWCGHAFSQLNLKKNSYQGSLHSYFQNEGDQEFELKKVLLEDEIWTMIRLRPNALPQGQINLIPGSQFLRLKHRDYATESAKASLISFTDSSISDKVLNKYTIEYEDFERVLEITFEKEFPFVIQGWEEHIQSGFGTPKSLITKAVRTHSINSAYWGQHDVADSHLRKELGLK